VSQQNGNLAALSSLLMKILMISDVYFPRVNGVSTSIETFRRTLAERGIRITLIAPDYGDGQDADGADIIRIPAHRLPFDPEDRRMEYGAIMRLSERLRQENYDLIHIQTPFVAHYAGIALAKQLGLPTVETYHTFFEEYLHHYLPFLPRAATRGIARTASRRQCNAVDAVIVPSIAMRDALLAYGVEKPMHILPTGIPIERFAQGQGAVFRSTHNIPSERPMLLYVGRVAFEKNIGFLLRATVLALRQRPDLLLVITGEGPALPALRREAETLGLADAVRFVGYLDRKQELPDCYNAANAFVFASRTETQGLVLIEAMAAGTPAIALSIMGTADILAPQRGARIAEDDEADFAAKIVTLIDDPALQQKLSAEARAYAAEWSAPALAESLQNLYAQLT
jgi:glycosyltransferase involved in cell wall biosynthesis